MPANIHNHRFLCQRYTAGLRGIKWNLTFQEWWDWWQATGHYHERGCKRGQYVMARPGDIGPYALDNIFCKTHIDNTLEYAVGRKRVYKKSTHVPWNKGKTGLIYKKRASK